MKKKEIVLNRSLNKILYFIVLMKKGFVARVKRIMCRSKTDYIVWNGARMKV